MKWGSLVYKSSNDRYLPNIVGILRDRDATAWDKTLNPTTGDYYIIRMMKEKKV